MAGRILVGTSSLIELNDRGNVVATAEAQAELTRRMELREIGERAQELAQDAEQVHVMFNNNARDLAPKAAYRMRKDVLGQV